MGQGRPRLPSVQGGTELSSGDRLLLPTARAPTHQASQNFFDRLGRSVFLRRRNHLSTFLTGRSHCWAKVISSPWKTTRPQGSGSGPPSLLVVETNVRQEEGQGPPRWPVLLRTLLPSAAKKRCLHNPDDCLRFYFSLRSFTFHLILNGLGLHVLHCSTNHAATACSS